MENGSNNYKAWRSFQLLLLAKSLGNKCSPCADVCNLYFHFVAKNKGRSVRVLEMPSVPLVPTAGLRLPDVFHFKMLRYLAESVWRQSQTNSWDFPLIEENESWEQGRKLFPWIMFPLHLFLLSGGKTIWEEKKASCTLPQGNIISVHSIL